MQLCCFIYRCHCRGLTATHCYLLYPNPENCFFLCTECINSLGHMQWVGCYSWEMDGTKQNTIEGPSKSPAKLPWSVQNSRYCPFSCPQDASPPTSRYLPTLNLPCFHHSETPFPLTSQGWLRTGDSESHGEGLGVAFLNINMHNSVAGKLFLESDDELLRLFIRGQGQFT